MEEVEGLDTELLSFLQVVWRLEYILIHLTSGWSSGSKLPYYLPE